MTASMVMTVYEYPVFATSGFATVFYVVVAGIFWFIPVALIAAEFASIKLWPKEGIFSWVSRTLGDRFGFVAIFFQWFQITVGFITMIFFIVGALSYVLNWPEMITTPWIYFLFTIGIFWVITFSQFFGTKLTTLISRIGFVGGIIIPVSILFGMGILYIVNGEPLQITFSMQTLIPDFSKIDTLVVFAGFILAFMGIEASATHIDELNNSKKTYPIVMIGIVVLAIVLDSLGGIIIASVINLDTLGANIGLIQALEFLFSYTFKTFGLGAEAVAYGAIAAKVIALVICFGVVAEIAAWVVGPSKGMYQSAKRGYLPSFFAKQNKYKVPVNFVLLQGILATMWAAILVFGSGGSGGMSFLLAIGLTVVLYLIAYLLFFMGYIVLIIKHKDLQRSYNVPFGKYGKWILVISGSILSVFTLIISIVPPASLVGEQKKTYLLLIIVCTIISVLAPLLWYQFYSKKHIVIDSRIGGPVKIYDDNGNPLSEEDIEKEVQEVLTNNKKMKTTTSKK